MIGRRGMTYDEQDAYVTRQCLVRGRRAAMTDEEFWADVQDLRGVGAIPLLLGDDGPDLDEPDPPGLGYPDPCSECGEVGACGYDAEGRPLIHVQRGDDDG